MSASDHLGRQWQQPELSFEVHRGLSEVTPKDVDTSMLGRHWSADKHIATSEFALDRNKGTVYHASVPVSSVDTDTVVLKDTGVMWNDETNNIDWHNPEKEVPVRRGKPVLITGISKVERGKRTRTRRYNPPREMKA